MTLPVLAVVVPCFNEEEAIESTVEILSRILSDLKEKNEISDNSFLFFVDDGSTDSTWNLIKKYKENQELSIKGAKFSKNFGNQNAILAGLFEASKYNADCYISIDADLQQDENKIIEFVQKYKNGAQIVFGIRKDRKVDSFSKKCFALAFYNLMNLLNMNVKMNHSEYRLISKNVVETLKQFSEKNMFLRGIFSNMGFKTDFVVYDFKTRKSGKTKFNMKSLMSLAIDGIISNSTAPLRFISLFGIILLLANVIFLTVNNMLHDWIKISCIIGIVGGLQILCLGIVAEYIAQMFQEVKSRPRYIIEEIIA